MKRKKIISVILVVMVLLLSSIPVMASSRECGFEFDVAAGISQYAGPATKPAGSDPAYVEVYQLINSYSRDNIYFRLYKSRSTSSPITETKTVNAPYSFDLNYTSSGTSYSGNTYLRGYGSAANLDGIYACGVFWA